MQTQSYLLVGAILFFIGALGVLIRRNPLVIFMSIEMMLNAVNLTLVAYAKHLSSMEGQIFVFFVMTVAAAEVVVGLAIIVSIFRTRENIDVDLLNSMKG
ncbi:MAG TPA: NADH-quinone oxidoreductase subunit NuoK [Chloroflexota bacterium]|nr:NADH-quinone oxidoreductase subunit NuoK [Chloroflexota bacterium]